MNTIELMSQEQFESYLANKYGANCYALKIARAEAGRVKATVRLKAVEPVAEPVVEVRPENPPSHWPVRVRSGRGTAMITEEAFKKMETFEAALLPGASIRVCWTEGGCFCNGTAEVVQKNAKSVRVRLADGGREIVVPLVGNLWSGRWSCNNRILPADGAA